MKSLKILAIVIITSLSFTNVFSQEVAAKSDSTLIMLKDLEEVEVYGIKHNTSLSYQAISATSISSREMETREINSIKELTSRIPNFFMPDYGSKLTSPVYVRGIGSRINSPAVALYVDNIPYFEKSAFDFEIIDVDRVEVLRGPQGTLYGRNTMGGVINIFTKKPAAERETQLKISGGNYGSYRTHISHNQPLTQGLLINVAGSYNTLDGYYLNEFTNAKVDDTQGYAGRLKLSHKVTSNFSGEYTFSYDHSYQGGYPYAIYNDVEQTTSAISYDSYSYYQRDMFSGNALFRYDGKSFDITSITSYQYVDDYQDIDQDFTPSSLFVVIQDQKHQMVSQEVIVKSLGQNRKIDWLFGAFGFTQQFDKVVDVSFGEDGVALYGLPGPTSQVRNFDHKISGAALFQQSTINNIILSGLSLSLGVRIDAESATLDFAYDRIIMGNSTRLDDFVSQLNFLNVLPKGTLTYEYSPRNMVYASVAKGYNSGGFNSTFERDEDRTFNPEVSWNYEVGAKNSWFNKHLISKVSIFYIDWVNQQISQPVPSGQGLMLTNAGQSVSKGGEIELIGQVNGNIRVMASYGYTDAYFVNYERSETVNFNGNKIPYIPEHTFDIGGTYSFPLGGHYPQRIDIDVNYRGIGKHYWTEENIAYQDFYGLLNAKVNFVFNRFSVGVWGKNMLNAEYNSFYFKALGNSYVQIGKPALFGITANVKF